LSRCWPTVVAITARHCAWVTSVSAIQNPRLRRTCTGLASSPIPNEPAGIHRIAIFTPPGSVSSARSPGLVPGRLMDAMDPMDGMDGAVECAVGGAVGSGERRGEGLGDGLGAGVGVGVGAIFGQSTF